MCVIACPAGLVHFEDAAGCNTHQLDGLHLSGDAGSEMLDPATRDIGVYWY